MLLVVTSSCAPVGGPPQYVTESKHGVSELQGSPDKRPIRAAKNGRSCTSMPGEDREDPPSNTFRSGTSKMPTQTILSFNRMALVSKVTVISIVGAAGGVRVSSYSEPPLQSKKVANALSRTAETKLEQQAEKKKMLSATRDG
jgi:hypothetical protein